MRNLLTERPDRLTVEILMEMAQMVITVMAESTLANNLVKRNKKTDFNKTMQKNNFWFYFI